MQRISKYSLGMLKRNYSSAAKYSYETLEVKKPSEYVVHVALNRPDKRNCISGQLITDFKNCIEEASNDQDCRAVVLSGNGKMFCAGIDFESLMEFGQVVNDDSIDVSRKYKQLRNAISNFQGVFSSSYYCPKPVIAAIHDGCIGAGTAIAAGADIRMCSTDAWFQVKEVEVGLAADVGILQKLVKGTGNDSLVRELAFTARKFKAEEALRVGFISRICKDREELMKDALELAKTISEKGPVPVQVTKQAINYSTDNSIKDGLEYMALVNGTHLQSEDMTKSFMAIMNKEKPSFSKL